MEQKNINIFGSILPDETAEVLEKGRKLPVGTIRQWGNKSYVKVAEGKWVLQEKSSMRISTEERYGGKSGNWTEERSKLHKSIIERHIRGAKKSEVPTVTLMMGAPGSGKGTIQRFLRSSGDMPESLISVDPDEIKTKDLKSDFDEYSKFNKVTASRKVHEEGSYLAKQIIRELSEIGADFIIDKVFFKERGLRDQIKQLTEKGYRVKIIMVSLPKEVGFTRALERARKSGRYIDKKSASIAYDQIDATFDNIFSNPPEGVVEINQFDTNVKLGENPKLKKSKKL